jgi:hypothetical protein
MIGDLFTPVEQLAGASGMWSYAAAVVLGFLAIWLSPCHLVGLTLASTYLRRHAGGTRQVALALSAFLVAMLATAALVAAATLALGRLAGDTGTVGAMLAIAQRGANWLGDHGSTRLRWARTMAGFLLVALAGWMTANAIMTG